MRKPLVPILDGFDVRNSGSDWRYVCRLCKDELLVDKGIAGDVGIPVLLRGHDCKPALLILNPQGTA